MSEIKKHTIYLYRSRLDGRCKVGVTSDPKRRHEDHVKGQSGCDIFDRYINARARDGHRRHDIFDYFTLRVFKCDFRYAEDWERYYTKVYKASVDDGGFVLKIGGYRGSQSNETRQKISDALKGKYTGEKAYWYGKTFNEETCRKISESKKGENNPAKRPEVRKKMSDSMKGNKNSAGEKALRNNAAEKNTLTFNFK